MNAVKILAMAVETLSEKPSVAIQGLTLSTYKDSKEVLGHVRGHEEPWAEDFISAFRELEAVLISWGLITHQESIYHKPNAE